MKKPELALEDEDEEQAVEAEARRMYDDFRATPWGEHRSDWSDSSENVKDAWRNLARREMRARALYMEHISNHPVIHANRFSSWDELPEKTRETWRARLEEVTVIETKKNVDLSPLLKKERPSIQVLQECIDLQRKKGADYNGDDSPVKQAMYYPRGIDSINDIVNAKMLRIKSVLDLIKKGKSPNFESLEDSYMDACNYMSFAITWLRGEMDGQDLNNNIFNEPPSTMIPSLNTIREIPKRKTP